ncbi:MAG: CoA-binding protein [Bacteroidetes bacterium]|jgi:predicted CoA-binding protein|nr:CoA-binding protein [Bacteroidota bacterium]
MNKPTVVIGASDNPDRYAYKATVSLQSHGHTVYPVGLKDGEINGIKMTADRSFIPDVHTVTMYVGPKNQPSWYEYILSLKPKRIIFNPGAENPDLVKLAVQQGIECEESCTLVMLSIDRY